VIRVQTKDGGHGEALYGRVARKPVACASQ
jgi:hypothetical protein